MAIVAETAAIDATHGDVIHLEVGQPSTGAPVAGTAAAVALLESGDPLGYTDPCGTPELRSAIAGLYRDRYDVPLDPSQVVVTTGASAGCVLGTLAAFDACARVGVVEPGYPCYRQILEALDCEAVTIRAGSAAGFRPTPAALDDAGPLDGCVVASPSNPTGYTLSADELDGLVAWADRRDTRLVVDEIYHGITVGRDEPTAAATIASRTGRAANAPIVVGSFSKYHCMTGWRLGWLVLPDELIEPVERLTQNLYLAPPTLAQHVALATMGATEELDANVARYDENRQVLIDGLTALGVTEIAPATGAFYVWARSDHWSDDSAALCASWLRDVHVAVTPGVDFDRTDGRHWIRCSVAGPTADIVEALARLAEWDRRHRTALS